MAGSAWTPSPVRSRSIAAAFQHSVVGGGPIFCEDYHRRERDDDRDPYLVSKLAKGTKSVHGTLVRSVF
jgi:hypothetical protein